MGLWVLLTFGVPLVVSVLLVLGLATGAGHTDADADAEVHAEPGDYLSILGWGRTPLLLSLTIALLLFGCFGFVATWFNVPGVISVPSAFAGMYVCGGWLSRSVARWLPSIETKSVRRYDFVGRSATVILPAGPKEMGLVQLSVDNDLYQFSYRHTGVVEFKQGDHVVIADIDQQTRVCTVMDDPTRWGT